MNINEYIKLGRKLYEFVSQKNSIGEYPTVREVARLYGMRQKDILTLIEDNDDLDYNIGIRVGSGIYVERYIGDYTIETTA